MRVTKAMRQRAKRNQLIPCGFVSLASAIAHELSGPGDCDGGFSKCCITKKALCDNWELVAVADEAMAYISWASEGDFGSRFHDATGGCDSQSSWS